MLTRNNVIGATIGAGLLVFCLLGTALYDPLDLRTVWKSALAAKSPINDEAVLYDNALGHFRAKDDLLAQDVTNRLLHVSPRSARGHKLMAALHLRDEDWVAALKEGRIAAQLDPNDPLAQMAIGQALKGLGDKQGAQKAFEKVTASPVAPPALKDKARDSVQEITERLRLEADPAGQ